MMMDPMEGNSLTWAYASQSVAMVLFRESTTFTLWGTKFFLACQSSLIMTLLTKKLIHISLNDNKVNASI